MKKAILSLACAAIALAAQAISGNVVAPKSPLGFHQNWQADAPAGTIEVGPAVHFGPSRADETLSMEYMLAGEPYTALGFNGQTVGMTQAYGFQFTADEATKYAGNQVDYVTFYTSYNGNDEKNHIKRVTVCLTYDLQGTPFYTEEFTGLPETVFTKVKAELATPYTIEAGKEFYVYVKFLINDEADSPIIVDYTGHAGDEAGWVAYGNTTTLTWDNISGMFGFVCIGAGLSGSNLPTNSMDVTNYAIDPAVEQNKPFDLSLMLKNSAANPITSFEYEVTVGDNEPETLNYEIPGEFRFNQETIFQVTGLTYATASSTPINVTFKVTKVNGVANNSLAPELTCQTVVLPEGKTYVRNVVIEEATGVWCGYCPAGIVTMEAIRENFPDGEFIPVGVHGASIKDDPMYASTYSKVFSLIANSGVPSALLNRSVDVYPFPYEEVLEYYEMVRRVPGLATVSATAEFSDDRSALNIHTTFAFCFDDNSEKSIYRLAYGITEDNVGPYNQTNYYSGEDEEVGGWESKPNPASTMYNDVARQLNSYNGILNSVPGTIVAGQEYTHDYALKLATNIKDKDKINLVVYLVNTNR